MKHWDNWNSYIVLLSYNTLIKIKKVKKVVKCAARRVETLDR